MLSMFWKDLCYCFMYKRKKWNQQSYYFTLFMAKFVSLWIFCLYIIEISKRFPMSHIYHWILSVSSYPCLRSSLAALTLFFGLKHGKFNCLD